MKISVTDIPALQHRGRQLVKEGTKLMQEVYDRPNGHGLLELINRTLPILVYLRLVTAGDFERHHQVTKRVNPSRWFIRNAMHTFNVVDTMRLLLHGTRWGAERQYQLGPGLRFLEDPRNPGIPHPLITNITSVLSKPIHTPPHLHRDLYHYNEEWFPSFYEKTSTSNHPLRVAPDAKISESIFDWLQSLEEDVSNNNVCCNWRYPTRLRKFFKDGSHLSIKVGHTVVCDQQDQEAIGKIHKIIEGRYHPNPNPVGRPKRQRRFSDHSSRAQHKQGEWRFVFVQVRWYDEIASAAHPIRKTKLMTLRQEIDATLFPCGLIHGPTLAIHACRLTNIPHPPQLRCCVRRRRNERLPPPCTCVAKCSNHGLVECKSSACADTNEWKRTIVHNYDHPHFEIVGVQQGVHHYSKKDMKYVDFSSQTFPSSDG